MDLTKHVLLPDVGVIEHLSLVPRTPITCTVFCKCQGTVSCRNPFTDNTGAVSDDDAVEDETDDEATDNN